MELTIRRRKNLLALMAQRKLKQARLAELCDTTAQYVSHIMNSGTFSRQFARRVESALEVGEGWLDVDRAGPKMTVVPIRTSNEIREPGSELHAGGSEITFLHVSVSAFAFEAVDDSMAGLVEEGEVLIVDPELQPGSGDLVLLSNTHGVFVRRFLQEPDGVLLAPTLPRYSSTRLDDRVRIVGVVVEVVPQRRALRHAEGASTRPNAMFA